MSDYARRKSWAQRDKCQKCEQEAVKNIEIEKAIKKHMDECDKKFEENNPCPKCGSHNVDIDLGTPTWCKDCGHEW